MAKSSSVARLCWTIGCLGVSTSIAESAYLRHGNQFSNEDKASLYTA